MFKNIILGYYRSPSLGSKAGDYQKKLQEDTKWWIFSFFSIIFVFFTIFLVSLLSVNNSVKKIYEVKNTANNKNLLYSVNSTAKNLLQPNDIISYRLYIKNLSQSVQYSNFETYIEDILQYAELVDGGDYKIKDSSIYWDMEKINPGESKSKIFAIKIKNKIPYLKKNGSSFDCKIDIAFGNTSSNKIKCTELSILNNILSSSAISEDSMTISLIVLFFISLIMVLRTNLLYREIRFFTQHSKEMKQ